MPAAMPAVRAAALLWALVPLLVAGGRAEEVSPASQLVLVLQPAMEAAVSRALASWQPAALTELTRLQTRLDSVERELTELRRLSPRCGRQQQPQISAAGQDSGTPPVQSSQLQREQELKTGTGTELGAELGPELGAEPRCERSPSPLPSGAAPHKLPAVRACARSCLQLRDQGGSPQDGVYWLTGLPVPALCDFSHDGGGWTLLLTAASRPGWDVLSVLSRSPLTPSLEDNYSILVHGDAIRDLGSGGRFAYRIETQAEKGRQQWGGIWFAPRDYSFTHEGPNQSAVILVRKFNSWHYGNNGIEQRMPWLNTDSSRPALLTTSLKAGSSWWGTLVTRPATTAFDHSPWIHGVSERSGTVLYWMREEVV